MISARDRQLESVVGDESVDRREQLLVTVVHVFVEEYAGEADRLLRALVDVGANRVQDGEQRDELNRHHEHDGEQQHFATEAELPHRTPRPRRPPRGRSAETATQLSMLPALRRAECATVHG